VRTTDIVSADADGFLTLHGRADGTINRGGVKILPETVRGVLISHPTVRDAGVVGVPDARLGEVSFAAVEPAPGMPPDPDGLRWCGPRCPATTCRWPSPWSTNCRARRRSR
jgi:long-chain acyl-CoA synthetase